jgi:hypothetical protein
MDAGTAAPESGGHSTQNVAPDASESDDATDEASQTDGLSPDASPLEASADEDAPYNGADGSTSCPNGVSDLSNLGTGDFTVSFSITTMQTGFVELVSQRSACTGGDFWDIRSCAPDPQKRCTVPGSVLVETSSGGAYGSLDSKIAVNDGSPHDVAVARTSGVLTITIDGKVSGSGPSKASFASLPALQTGNGACVGHDSTQALTGTLSSLCITTN